VPVSYEMMKYWSSEALHFKLFVTLLKYSNNCRYIGNKIITFKLLSDSLCFHTFADIVFIVQNGSE